MNKLHKTLALSLALVMTLTMPLTSLAETMEVQPAPVEEAAVVTEVPVVAEAPVTVEPVAEAPVAEEPVAEAPVAEEPVVEAPVAEEPVVEAPVAEEPVVETPVAEEPVVEAPAAEEPVVETPVAEEPVVETPAIDCTKDLTENAAFLNGFARTNKTAEFFAAVNGGEALGTVAKDSGVEVLSRPALGQSGERVAVAFVAADGQNVKAFIAAKELTPMTDSESADYRRSPEVAVTFSAAEEPATEEPAAEETEVPATEEPAAEETEVPATEEPVAEETEVPAAEEPVVVETEIPVAGLSAEMVQGAERALPGATVITVGSTVTAALPAVAGVLSTKNYSMTLSSSGKLAMSFKAVYSVGGNVKVRITSADASATLIYEGVLSPSGTLVFSEFVNAGSYDISISKVEPTDVTAYYVTINSSTSFLGELNTTTVPNTTVTNATALAVDGVSHIGIRSKQDVTQGASDYYKIVLTQRGKLTLGLENRTGAAMQVYFYGDDTSTSNQIASMTLNGPAGSENAYSTVSQRSWFEAGTYYALVVDNGETGRYALRASFETLSVNEVEPNNSISLANANNAIALNGAYIFGVLTESDRVDYYHLAVTANTYVRASCLAQMHDVDLEIQDMLGAKVVTFGGNNTVGEEGVAYEYEQKDILLTPGDYYLKVSSTKEAGLYAVQISTELTITAVNIIANGNVLTGSFTTAYGNPLQGVTFVCRNSNGVIIGSTNQSTLTVVAPATDTYTFEVIAYDGTSWRKLSNTYKAEIGELKINSVTVTTNTAGVIHIEASVTSGRALTLSNFSIYRNGVRVGSKDTVNSMSVDLQAPVSGTYVIQYAVSDGITLKDYWGTKEVVVPAQELPLTISALDLTVSNNNSITASMTTSNGGALKATTYYLYYNSAVIAQWSGNSKSHTFTVNAGGTYIVRAVATDGKNESTAWAKTEVVSSATLQVGEVRATANDAGLITINTDVYGGKTIQATYLRIYRGSTLIQTIDGKAQSFQYMPTASGSYTFQFTAFDGTTWAAGWSATLDVTVSVANLPLEITELNMAVPASAPNSGTIECSAKTQYGKTVTKSVFYLYRGSTMIASSAELTKEHTFFVDQSGHYTLQYVVSDGVTTQVGWKALDLTVTNDTYSLEIASINLVDNHDGTLTCTALAQFGRGTVNYCFQLWDGATMIGRVWAGTSTTALFTNVPDGTYGVQVAAIDDVTMVSEIKTVTMLKNLPNGISNATATIKSSQVECKATINGPFVSGSFILYNSKQEVVGQWSGSSLDVKELKHTFDVTGCEGGTFQCILYDGTTWSNAWGNIV